MASRKVTIKIPSSLTAKQKSALTAAFGADSVQCAVRGGTGSAITNWGGSSARKSGKKKAVKKKAAKKKSAKKKK